MRKELQPHHILYSKCVCNNRFIVTNLDSKDRFPFVEKGHTDMAVLKSQGVKG